MRARWRPTIALCTAFAAIIGCSSSGSGGPRGSHRSIDAGNDRPALDAIQESPIDADGGGVDSGPDVQLVGCVPRPVDGGFEYVPPKTRRDVCTKAQIQALYDACYPGSGSSCSTFYNDPANSPCILCMISEATAPQRGAVVGFSNDIYFANVGGCMALVDPDAGPGNCPQVLEAYQTCIEDSCLAGCPLADTSNGARQTLACQDQAAQTDCLAEQQAQKACLNVPAYTPCVFASFEAAFLGLGQFFCAAVPEGGVDAAPDSAPEAGADGAPDGGADAPGG